MKCEKWFTLASYSNRRKDQIIWCKGGLDTVPEELRYVEVRQREAGTMFLGIIASDGKVCPTVSVPSGVNPGEGGALD